MPDPHIFSSGTRIHLALFVSLVFIGSLNDKFLSLHSLLNNSLSASSPGELGRLTALERYNGAPRFSQDFNISTVLARF